MRAISRRQLLWHGVKLGLLTPLLAACSRGAAPKPAEGAGAAPGRDETAAEKAGEHTASEGPHWTYEGDEGPEHWADIDPAFAPCSGGLRQSPLDLTRKAGTSDLETIVFDYKPTQLNVVNNGHTVQVDYDPGSRLILNNTPYDLVQFHFHVPSEHRLNGMEFPMEAHLVHRASDGSLAVVGMLFYGGVINKPYVMAAMIKTPVLDTIWQDMPSKGSRVASKNTVNVADLLPVDRQYITYEGSLTTPPCTEGVRWILLTTPSVVGLVHTEKFISVVGRNARPVQPLNGRQPGGGYAQAGERKTA
jgi:carbonic anhydrase